MNIKDVHELLAFRGDIALFLHCSLLTFHKSTFFYYANLISDDVILCATKKW